MNYLKIVSAALLVLVCSQAKSQDTEFGKPDKPAKCKNIRSGKFLRANYPEGIWYMTIKGNTQTEYFNNGKDYIKSTLVFVDDCNYKVIVLEKSDKNDPMQVGDVVNNTIVETQDNLIKLHSKIGNDQFEVIYVKEKK
ncbi:hypothetical protein ACM46_12400 [Chryseobacterium angstadtii]|uniref:Lipocalin-like domain-containing protein n=1 Tax=Chryseobacterium angstadtii TaxID=558151 RepID=A0A0J7IG56_9FLAO|nr:hypothetical protein [Chryseobacterium angstadtii]KMQ64994.1 hypothetical protein ACM46_12400 [Chryseobacterium angstadtii]